MSTIEDWTDVMYINMYGCTNYGYEASEVSAWVHEMCNNTDIGTVEHVGGPIVSLYFVSFILLASLVMM